MDNKSLWQRKNIYFAVLVFIILCSIFAAIMIFTALKSYRYIGQDRASMNTISVSGEGEVFAKPDIATFDFSVVQEASTVADAQKKVNDKINSAIDSLKKNGIDEKDIKTQNYNIYPKYEYQGGVCSSYGCPPSKNVFTGYEVSQAVTVKVRKIEDVSKIIGDLGSKGITNVNSLVFDVEEKDQLQRDARKEAIAKAKEKAKVLANDLGINLGKMINFSESNNDRTYPVAYGMGGADMAKSLSSVRPELPTGQNKITSNVNIVYEIR
jgi:uncharacterized protein YggE